MSRQFTGIPTFLQMPPEVALMDSAFIAGVRGAAESIGDTKPIRLTWSPPDGMDKASLGVFEALEPLHETVLKIEVDNYGRQPQSIIYGVCISTVQPGESQLAHAWHSDSLKGYVVSDTLPLEVLAAKGKTLGAPDHQVKGWMRDYGIPADDQLDLVGLEAVPVNSLAVIALLNRKHRSQLNLTDHPIERTWARASVVRNLY